MGQVLRGLSFFFVFFGGFMTVTDMPLRNLDHGFDLTVGEVGVSVRYGNKWAVEQGFEFDLVEQYSNPDHEDKVVGRGRALGFWRGPFNELPGNLLNIEHNFDARNYHILKDMLSYSYPDFTEESEVTALIYERTE